MKKGQTMDYFEEYEASPLLKENDQKQGFVYKFRALFHYLLSSFLVSANLCAFSLYMWYKISLYIKEFADVLASPWVLLVLVCECGYYLNCITSSIEFLLPPWMNNRPPCPLPEYEKDYPRVDILLPCCKEPTDVVEDTILAAMAQDYPKDKYRILVLDDGADEELKYFCQTLKLEIGQAQVEYLRRKKIPGVPHHFKCGNLNFGLTHSNSEYVAMLDADMILDSTFLSTVLPHIINSPNVAFVQVPQAYYNLPVGDPFNDCSASFYERNLVQRNLLGSASCVGTGAVFRRAHLDSIGGYQPQSLTEDCITAYALLSSGFRSVYLNKKLQIGLAPWSFDRYLNQRERWCIGAIQQFAYTWKKTLGHTSKLNLLDKMIYISYTGFYYLSILNVIMMVVFIFALAFRLNLLIGDHSESRKLLAYLAAYLVIQRLSNIVQCWGIPQHVQTRNREESHFWWMTPFFLKTVLHASFPSTMFTFTYKITNAAVSKVKKSIYAEKINELKPLTFHLVYASIVIPLVSWQSYVAHTRGGLHNCREFTYVGGISMFLLSICFHMLVPVFYVLRPTGFPDSMRKSMLKYDSNGVPHYSKTAWIPKWHWPVIFYEIMSYATIAIWAGVFYITTSKKHTHWCKP